MDARGLGGELVPMLLALADWRAGPTGAGAGGLVVGRGNDVMPLPAEITNIILFNCLKVLWQI